MKRIRVLVVDDSAFMRRMVTDILKSDPHLDVVGVARNGQEALEQAKALKPDVVTLDVQMPVLDGIATLERLMKEEPMPVLMLSSETTEGSAATIRCLELGAVDFVAKPSGSISFDLYKVSSHIVDKVRAAAKARGQLRRHGPDGRVKATFSPRSEQGKGCLVVIGASTGGPRALTELFEALPDGLPASVLVVQHMPVGFTKSFAERLDRLSGLDVSEARDGDRLEIGHAYVAPGGSHLKLDRGGVLRLSLDPPLHGVRPAVDITMMSAAQNSDQKLMGVIMTGMGNDGAAGVRALHKKGALIIAEHESSCIVYGMPRAAVQTGCVDRIAPLDELPAAITEGVKERCKTALAS